MTMWGYARVSTGDQDAGLQIDALTRAGVQPEHVVVEHVSGSKPARPALDALLERLQAGDELVVWKLDRLGRSLSHLVALVDEFGRRGVEFRSLTDHIDTTTPSGKLVFHLIASVAEFERDLIVERTRAGLAQAKREGKQLGRRSPVTDQQLALIQQMHDAGHTQKTIALTTGLSRAAVGRVLRGEIASLAARQPDTEGLQLYPPARR